MLSDEPIDEDLEALLYAQVYYGKEQDVELPNVTESELTKPDRKEQDQVGTASGKTYWSKHIYQKKRYFENNLVQEDKQQANIDIFAREPYNNITEENLNSENIVIPSPISSNIAPEISEKSIQDHTIPTQKDQDIESTANQQRQFIQISTSSPSTNSSSKDSTQIVTTTVLTTPSESSHPQLLNNITINQYLFPPDFEQRLKSSLENNPLSKKCKSDLRKLKKGGISEQEFFNNLKRRLKVQRRQQSQIRKAYLKRQQAIAHSEVICLSDSDSSEIEVVDLAYLPKDSKKDIHIMKDKVEGSLDASDHEAADEDEIIYVAPPPVPVISVDTDSDSEASGKDRETSEDIVVDAEAPSNNTTSQNLLNASLDVDETSNDFLQPQNTSDKFNFSLHGSDFQNTDFVRPANPTDAYETESSTSTSDFNRESSRQFCNSVKTIVFNEVEFPNQDIFDESNLESFGEFITPKRGDKERNSELASSSTDKPSTSMSSKRVNPRTLSESSSESEYEGSNVHQNLPDLSPMVCAESSPKKGKTSKKITVDQPKKKKGKSEVVDNNTKSSRKKSKEKVADKFDGTLDAADLPKEPIRKSKRKSSSAVVEEEDEVPRKKPKKRKNKSGTRSTEENEALESFNSASDRAASTKKNLKDSSKTTEKEADVNNVVDNTSKKKNKKKKKQVRNEDESEVNKLVDNLEEHTETLPVKDTEDTIEGSGRKKGKRKKSKESSVSKGYEEGKIGEDQSETLEEKQAPTEGQSSVLEDDGKKKNKKRKQKEASESRVVLEACTISDGTRILDIGEEDNTSKNSSENVELLAAVNSLTEQNVTAENNSNKKKNKRKKRSSIDKRGSVEESNAISKNDNARDTEKGNDGNLEKPDIVESRTKEKSGEVVVVEGPEVQEEEDVILIEKVIPVLSIESSESDEDILTFDDVGYDLELANISESKVHIDEVIDNRNFDVDYVQSKMSDDPEKWKILPSDRYNLSVAKKGPRCNKCRHFGHISINCPNKPALPVCTLCGETGHQEPRCPNKVCFTCGKPGNFTTVYCYMCANQRNDKCSLCSIIGHRSDYCPDLWRRYFLTTTQGPLTVPKKNCPKLKPRNKQWCSGCASNGHLEFQCNTYKWMREYPVSSPKIFKYNDIYEDSTRRKKRRGADRDDRSKLFYERFLAKTLKVPEHGDQQENVAQNPNVPDKTPEETNPQLEVPAIEKTQDISRKPSESRGSRNENVVENQQSTGPSQTDTVYQGHDMPQGRRGRNKQFGRSPRHAKINPLSMMLPEGFTPYRSVLNPYSLMGAPVVRPLMDTPVVRPLMDVPVVRPLMSAPVVRPPQGLFNQVPSDVLAKQLLDLANCVVNYQASSNFNRENYDFSDRNQPNIYQVQQFGLQIPPNPRPLFGPPNTYQDFSEPLVPEPYQDVQEPQSMHGNRDFLDRPHTITRDPNDSMAGERLNFQAPESHVEERRELFTEDRTRQISTNSSNPPLDAPSTKYQPFLEQIIPEPICDEVDIYSKEAFTEVKGEELAEKIILEEETCQRGGVDLRKTLNNPRNASSNFKSLETATETQSDEYSPKRDPRRSPVTTSVRKLTKNKFINSKTEDLKAMVSYDLKTLDIKKKTHGSEDHNKYKDMFDAANRLQGGSIEKKYFLYRQLNMYIFGMQKLSDAKQHLEKLHNFLDSTGRIGASARRKLLKSYAYIFGGEHPNFDYRRCLYGA